MVTLTAPQARKRGKAIGDMALQSSDDTPHVISWAKCLKILSATQKKLNANCYHQRKEKLRWSPCLLCEPEAIFLAKAANNS
jgi:hypothetical protein